VKAGENGSGKITKSIFSKYIKYKKAAAVKLPRTN
jgi:lipase chaperone LimK